MDLSKRWEVVNLAKRRAPDEMDSPGALVLSPKLLEV
jgi:hypothetical protein